MFKLRRTETLKDMRDMKPCEICVVVDAGLHPIKNDIVMRTASVDSFEVMSLSCPGPNKCILINKQYTSKILVKTLEPGTEVTLIVQ